MDGRIESKWILDGNYFRLAVTIPANTEGIVTLPVKSVDSINENGQKLSLASGIREIRKSEGQVIVTIGSGLYEFETKI